MVVPAMQLASKIPDMSVQLWSSALLKGTAASTHTEVIIRFYVHIRLHEIFSQNMLKYVLENKIIF